jgi:hypothetical protein
MGRRKKAKEKKRPVTYEMLYEVGKRFYPHYYKIVVPPEEILGLRETTVPLEELMNPPETTPEVLPEKRE